MRSEEEVNRAVTTYADTIRRVCFYHLKNQADTEDVFQNVFLKYMLHDGVFHDAEHEKAWLLRVAINDCKDFLKSFFRRNTVPMQAVMELEAEIIMMAIGQKADLEFLNGAYNIETERIYRKRDRADTWKKRKHRVFAAVQGAGNAEKGTGR